VPVAAVALYVELACRLIHRSWSLYLFDGLSITST
jgi:hypothetical protein